jgi:hypothetical protein
MYGDTKQVGATHSEPDMELKGHRSTKELTAPAHMLSFVHFSTRALAASRFIRPLAPLCWAPDGDANKSQ